MSARTAVHRTRVILGATCYADAEASLRIAVLLAKQNRADIHGCLVEDDAILASVAYPNARAVTYSGRHFERVSAESMQAAFRADAKRFENKLAAEARQASLASGFTEVRGQLPGILRKKADAGDLLVFGFRRVRRDSGHVVLAFGDTKPDPKLLVLALDLSHALGKRLTILAAPEFQSDIYALLSQHSLKNYDLAAVSGDKALLETLERMSPSALVVGFELSGLASVMRLLEAARCPVVMTAQSPSTSDQDAVPRPENETQQGRTG